MMKSYLSLVVSASLILLANSGHAENSKANLSASAALVEARTAYDAGELQTARTKIAAAIKADPKLSEAHYLAAQIADKSGDPQSSFNEYIAADATGRGDSKGRHAAADLLIRMKAYKVAEEWIAKCLADRPADRSMKAYRALLAERLGDVRKARNEAEQIVADDNGNAVANAVLAEEALRRNDPAYALTKIAAGLSTDASDRALLQLKAQALLMQNSKANAAEIYRTLILADPSAPEYRWSLAELLAQTNIAEGEQALREGVAAAPASIDMHMRLIVFLVRHRDSSAVEKELNAAIASMPETTAYDIALAEFYENNGRADAATKVLNEAIARTNMVPARVAAQLALARLQISLDDIISARTVLETMLKAKTADDNVLAVRGQLLLKDRKPAGAIQDFLVVAARQPANPAVFAALADAYLQNDQYDEAVAALRRVSSLTPSDPRVARRIVDIQNALGNVTDANRTVDDFLARNPSSVDARVIKISLALQAKDWTAADVALTAVYHSDEAEADRKAVGLDAEVKEARGQQLDAAGLYRRLLIWKEVNPFDGAAARGFVRTSIAAGRSAQAVDELAGLASRIAPAEVQAYNLALAMLYDNLGQTEKSQALVEAAIQKAPTEPTPYLQQARVFARKNDTQSAVAFLQRGIAAGAPKEPLLLARAQIQNAAGEIDQEIAAYREVLAVAPKSTVAANELANRLADQKPLNKDGLRQARDLLQKNAINKNLTILDTLAWSSYRLGEIDIAKKYLNYLANAGQSTFPQLRFHYGAVLIASGERAKGQDIIRTTLNDNYPGRDEADEMLKVSTVKAP